MRCTPKRCARACTRDSAKRASERKPFRFEPVEQGVDLLRDGVRVDVIVDGRIDLPAARVPDDSFAAQLEPALVALREQLQGARLQRPLHDYSLQRPPGRPASVAAPSGGSERSERVGAARSP